MTRFDRFLDRIGEKIRNRVSSPPDPATARVQTDIARLRRVLQPGDVILVDGNDKVSAAIRYLTQSSWSHAAMFVGDRLAKTNAAGEPHEIIEMNLGEGCVSAPLSKYRPSPTRVCRAVNLSPADRAAVIQYMVDRIGLQYDTRHVFDLARYLIPHPPVPVRWRRQMLALGSGEPTRAICSTLIAQAFHSIRYPILPTIDRIRNGNGMNGYTEQEIWHIRHHSLFAPRDFDVSPYFELIKPTVVEGFDYKQVIWSEAMQGWQPPTAPVALLPQKAEPRDGAEPFSAHADRGIAGRR
jgi:Permuted papain-like amidase enzyme, YaeF/YiiX, C92 family